MITLTQAAQDVPDVEVAGKGALAAGSVFVLKVQSGETPTQYLAAGQQVVLEVAGQRLELTTTDAPDSVEEEGTYLSSGDVAGLGGKPAKMRLYGWQDRRRKSLSGAGVLVWLPGLVGLVLAVLGLIFLASTAPTDRAAVADAAKDLQAWIVNPPATAPRSPAARVALAQRCLDGLAGRKIPANVKIDAIECKPAQPSGLHNKENAALVATVGGVITAALGLVAAATKLTFGHSP